MKKDATPRSLLGAVIPARDWWGPSDREVGLAVNYKVTTASALLQVGRFISSYYICFNHYHPWQVGPGIPARDDRTQQIVSVFAVFLMINFKAALCKNALRYIF